MSYTCNTHPAPADFCGNKTRPGKCLKQPDGNGIFWTCGDGDYYDPETHHHYTIDDLPKQDSNPKPLINKNLKDVILVTSAVLVGIVAASAISDL